MPEERVFLDTPLIVYVALQPEDGPYTSFLKDLLNRYSLVIDPLVIDESLYILRHKYQLPYKSAIQFLSEVILPLADITPLTSVEVHRMLHLLQEFGIDPADALHAAAAISANCSGIVSEDRDFDKIPFLKRIWLS